MTFESASKIPQENSASFSAAMPRSGAKIDIESLLPRAAGPKLHINIEKLLPLLLAAFDFVVCTATGILTLGVAPLRNEWGNLPLVVVFLTAITFVNLEKVTGVLDVGTNFPPYLKLLPAAFVCVLTFVLFFTISSVDGHEVFRYFERFSFWGVFCLAGMTLTRVSLHVAVQLGLQSGLLCPRIVLVGRPNSVVAYLRRFAHGSGRKPSLLAIVLTSGNPADVAKAQQVLDNQVQSLEMPSNISKAQSDTLMQVIRMMSGQ